MMSKQLKKTNGGYIPQQDRNAEMAVIGGMLIDTGAAGLVFQKMKSPDAFYDNKHALIFKIIQEIEHHGGVIDILTVADQARKMKRIDEIGGEFYLIDLAQKVSSTAHIEHHISIILQKYALRRVNQLGNLLVSQSFEPQSTAENILETAMGIIDKELAETSTQSFDEWSDVLRKVVEHVEKLSNADGPSGIPTGFSELDKAIGGWQDSELIVMAARPGMGKTALAVRFMINAAKKNKSVAICQLEMADVQFAKRIVANEAETLHANQLYKHGIRDDNQFKQFMDVVGNLEGLPITVIPKPGMTVFECRMEARKLKRSKKGLDLLVVDYLQLMAGGGQGGNREQEISQISRELKKLANELDIPILALSQLSRAVETRATKRPQLSDLRESGAIEQDADMVIFLYRPDYYGYDQWQDGKRVGETCVGLAELDIRKHRNGSLDSVVVGFDDNRVKFYDLNDVEPNV